MIPFKKCCPYFKNFFSYQNHSIFLFTLSLYHFFKGGGGGIQLVMFPFFCHLPRWLRQETSESKKCHLLEATAAANLILVWCLDSKAEESINKNWETKCLKVLVWWSQAHLHTRWNQTCEFFEGFCCVWVFWCLIWFWLQREDDLICVCVFCIHTCAHCAFINCTRKILIGCAAFSEVTLLLAGKGKIELIL